MPAGMNDGELDRKLRGLPPHDLDDLAAERVRRRAQAQLAAERRLQGRPVARAWSRYVTPVLLTGAVGGYLLWAISVTSALYR